MSRILLTGAAGLVGSHAVSVLCRHYEVHAIARRSLPTVKGIHPIVLDLATDWSAALLPPQVDAVVHLAQSGGWHEFPGRALEMFAVNLATTARLLDYAVRAGATCFVLASTGGLYGSCDVPVTEQTPLDPPRGSLRYYFETKRAAEMIASAYQDEMRISILRPFFIYGRGQRSSMLVPRVIESVRSQTPIQLRGHSGTRLNPVHVDDVVRTLEACLSHDDGQVVNVAGSEVTTLRSIANRIGELLGIEPTFVSEAGPPEAFVADIAVMRALNGCEPVGFDAGIATVLERERRS